MSTAPPKPRTLAFQKQSPGHALGGRQVIGGHLLHRAGAQYPFSVESSAGQQHPPEGQPIVNGADQPTRARGKGGPAAPLSVGRIDQFQPGRAGPVVAGEPVEFARRDFETGVDHAQWREDSLQEVRQRLSGHPGDQHTAREDSTCTVIGRLAAPRVAGTVRGAPTRGQKFWLGGHRVSPARSTRSSTSDRAAATIGARCERSSCEPSAPKPRGRPNRKCATRPDRRWPPDRLRQAPFQPGRRSPGGRQGRSSWVGLGQ